MDMARYLTNFRHFIRMAVCAAILFFPISASAIIVSQQQIADAIRKSPYSNEWLKQNADAIGKLAINVESGGNTESFNGSCCYGVLQMSKSNIRAYAKMTPEQYKKLDLQSQVNYWAKLTSEGLNHKAPRKMMSMSTFDGRPVTAELVLACVQLGTGNCNKSLRAGSCRAFADINGTNICKMADKTGRTPNIPSSGPIGCAAADPAEFLSDTDGYGSLDETNTGEYETMSPLEMILTEADRRLSSDNWQKKITQVSSRALWLDYTKVLAVENYLRRWNYEKNERIEAQMAVLTSIRLENLRNEAAENARRTEGGQVAGRIK